MGFTDFNEGEEMKKITLTKKTRGVLAMLVALVSITLFTAPQEAHASAAKIYAYMNGANCSDWYPNEYTCKDIFLISSDPYQQLACLEWGGVGSRG
jgi:hypothetical protein